MQNSRVFHTLNKTHENKTLNLQSNSALPARFHYVSGSLPSFHSSSTGKRCFGDKGYFDRKLWGGTNSTSRSLQLRRFKDEIGEKAVNIVQST